MRKRRRRNTIIWTIIGVLILIAGWFSFGPGIPSKTQAKTVTVGVVSQSKQDAAIWKSVAQTAKDKYGITNMKSNLSNDKAHMSITYFLKKYKGL